jgi:hypothetical protein
LAETFAGFLPILPPEHFAAMHHSLKRATNARNNMNAAPTALQAHEMDSLKIFSATALVPTASVKTKQDAARGR